jgi:hypothetical protein
MPSLRSFGAGAIALVCLACSVTSTTSNPGGSSSGSASAADVDRCKHSGCDKMKFFGCSSADEQAACYADCDKATSSQIDLFASCAENSVCDPACRTNIVPKPSGGSSSGSAGGGPTGGTGATASSCGTACDKLISCSFIPLGAKDQCVTECQKSAYQYQIDCVNSNACDKMKAACGDPTGGSSGGTSSGGTSTSGGPPDAGDTFAIQQCQSACDNLNFFSCIDAATHSTCRDTCTSAAASKRDTFTSCVNTSGGDCTKGQDCYAQFKQ